MSCKSNTHTHTHTHTHKQPPFDGDDDDQLFNNIMEKPVHYPRGLSDQAKKIILGVSLIKGLFAYLCVLLIFCTCFGVVCIQHIDLYQARVCLHVDPLPIPVPH